MMRTQQEIVDRIKAIELEDPFGIRRRDLIYHLDVRYVKLYLKPETPLDQWEPLPCYHEAIIEEMRSYMPFAWEKVNHCRGLSALRSIDHCMEWLWLLGEDKASQQLNDPTFYGKPELMAICDHYGWDWRSWCNGEWKGFETEPARPVGEATRLTWK